MFDKNNKILWLSIILPVGFLIGSYLGIQYTSNSSNSYFGSSSKQDRVGSVIDYVDKMYVDDVQREHLIEVAIEAITQELDPHTAYLSPEELAIAQEPMQGHFFGIGVEFMLIDDSINVLKTIPGGPSEAAGLKMGDKILFADTTRLHGKDISNALILKTLKGEKGSEVRVQVDRNGDSLSFPITRGSIPIPSVRNFNIIEDSIAVIKLLRFAETTDDEFFDQLDDVLELGIKNIVIDLRNNGGGYLTSTISICEKLLSKGDLIVYTEGKARPRKNFYAKGSKKYEAPNYYILINENSASASEILAGAFQDNDKATIIGQRSFGKGLVQEEHHLPAKAAIRLTVARYYTPSGRSIQKVYQDSLGNMIDVESYYAGNYHGITDSTEYFTKKGRIVYGGGGIDPDIKTVYDETDEQLSDNLAPLFPLIAYGGINAICFKYAEANDFNLGTVKEFDNNFNLIDFLQFVKKRNSDLEINLKATYSNYDRDYMKILVSRYLFTSSEAQYFSLKIDPDIPFLKQAIGAKTK
jgi:carboxyl-terminal processing protease